MSDIHLAWDRFGSTECGISYIGSALTSKDFDDCTCAECERRQANRAAMEEIFRRGLNGSRRLWRESEPIDYEARLALAFGESQ